MPFFANSTAVKVNDSKFTDVAGHLNVEDHSEHVYHEGSHVTRTTRTQGSNNNSSQGDAGASNYQSPVSRYITYIVCTVTESVGVVLTGGCSTFNDYGLWTV
jgi:hypothetical protein